MGRPSKFRHIVHNPNLPLARMDQSPGDSSLFHQPHLSSTSSFDPRDLQYTQAVTAHTLYNQHMTSSSPLLAQGSNHLYNALRGGAQLHSPPLPPHHHSGHQPQQQQQQPMVIKSEPTDFGYNQMTPPPPSVTPQLQGGYSPLPVHQQVSPAQQQQVSPASQQVSPAPQQVSPVPSDHADIVDPNNILRLSNPWNQMKTMNQETNNMIANTLISDNMDSFHQQYNAMTSLKYSVAGVTCTETTRSVGASVSSVAPLGHAGAPTSGTAVANVNSTYAVRSPHVHAYETNHAFTDEELELLNSIHQALEAAPKRSFSAQNSREGSPPPSQPPPPPYNTDAGAGNDIETHLLLSD